MISFNILVKDIEKSDNYINMFLALKKVVEYLALCPSFNEVTGCVYPSMECFISSIPKEDDLWRLQIEECCKTQ
jgi:hypothetical protein